MFILVNNGIYFIFIDKISRYYKVKLYILNKNSLRNLFTYGSVKTHPFSFFLSVRSENGSNHTIKIRVCCLIKSFCITVNIILLVNSVNYFVKKRLYSFSKTNFICKTKLVYRTT